MEKRITCLRWWDIGMLSLLLFGPALFTSLSAYLAMDPGLLTLGPEFTTADNLRALLTQGIQLALAMLYLRGRHFDFSCWTFRITLWGTIGAVFLFLAVAFLVDITSLFSVGWSILPDATIHWRPVGMPVGGVQLLRSTLTVPLVLYALLDGAYEEFFFLGICSAVPEERSGWGFLYALAVRVACHLYLGILPALSIGLSLGCLYAWMHRQHTENLYPFGLSHAIAVVVGLSILQFL